MSFRLVDPPPYRPRRFQDKALLEALLSIPKGAHDGWNRYDTDNEHVLHLWADGQSWDIRLLISDAERAEVSQEAKERA